MGQREALLEGSIACLQNKGYAGTTARDIVSASGANLSAIGYHYGSKDALLDAALNEAVRRWFEPLIALSSGLNPDDLPRLIRTAVDGFLAALPENRQLILSYFEALARVGRSEPLRANLAENFHTLRTALTRNLGSLRPGATDDAKEATASLVYAIFDGLIIQWMIDPSRLPSSEKIALSIEAVFSSQPPSSSQT